MISLDDLDYALPSDRIAQHPVIPRDAARLLVVDRKSDSRTDAHFRDVARWLGPHDLLVVNDTRVVPARIRGRKASGGQAELLLLECAPDGAARALVRTNGRLRPGLELYLGDAAEWSARIAALEPDGTCRLELEARSPAAGPLDALAAELGELPLPPYIRGGRACPSDALDYQTVFASVPGSVAAPTASLHFTPELARRLPIARLTLHVGPGTFRPIRPGSLDDHRLDPERFEISEACAEAMRMARSRGGRVIAVGTTVVRALETTGGRAGRGRADLFIRPGHAFRAVDGLITNFHLPRSSLLALVMAFGGVERVRAAYAHAIECGYRFYSYGDAMWLI